MLIKRIFVIPMVLLSSLYGQTDTLYFTDNTMMYGEVKGLKTGVLSIETGFSDSDFQISWDKVTQFYSPNVFIVSLDNNERLVTTLNSDRQAISNLILYRNNRAFRVKIKNVVSIEPVEEEVWDRFKISFDLGLNITKANNLNQFSTRGYMGYLTEKWNADATLDIVSSSQDSVATTQRTDGKIGFSYFLGNGWFTMASVGVLQNTEQKLDLRITPQIAGGNYIIMNSELYWGLYLGLSYNREYYSSDSTGIRESGEASAGTEFNIFDFEDLGLLTNLSVFKTITGGDRTRADFKFDIKYDLPMDFYIRLGYTLNYDSKPVEGASETDYVFQTSFGWEY